MHKNKVELQESAGSGYISICITVLNLQAKVTKALSLLT
jgi:hypothetical protein